MRTNLLLNFQKGNVQLWWYSCIWLGTSHALRYRNLPFCEQPCMKVLQRVIMLLQSLEFQKSKCLPYVNLNKKDWSLFNKTGTNLEVLGILGHRVYNLCYLLEKTHFKIVLIIMCKEDFHKLIETYTYKYHFDLAMTVKITEFLA